MEKLAPPRSAPLAMLHLANLVMPVAQWNALLAAVRKSLKHLIVHLFMLALQQGDGRDLLLPDDLLPVAGTLEELEVGTVLRPPGALHILPHLRSLSAHVAFPTVLPPPRSLPRALQCFRIVDERRAGANTWVWALAPFVRALLRERPPTLRRVEIVTWLNEWRQLRDWGSLAFLLHQLAAAVGVTLQIDLGAIDD
ncbi:hypothetical protein AURDEDRAFT_188762 [Auricularia subglabra TFB-10046 SS5]|uniref:Uncharacterized protein n=1 Tax=Auricularia subglabra (strain TFB-10046 / SS5) TaxID=717982 RepID=J0LEQ6_AURST|nr:hypothetical protein AURDEDRAFT_188762 [Auricularia subglabra TFB-10046 SS5]